MTPERHPGEATPWLVRRAVQTLTLLCSVGVLMLMVIICWEVVSRSLFNRPTSWAIELSSYLFLWIGLLAAGVTLAADRHLAVDLLISRLSGRVRAILNVVVLVLMLPLAAVLVWYGAAYWWQSYVTGWVHSWGLLFVPLSYTRSAVPMAGIILSVLIVVKIVQRVGTLWSVRR